MSATVRKVAVVTGGARGIGLAETRALAAGGYSVYACGRSAEPPEIAALAATADIFYLRADVSDSSNVHAIRQSLEARTGRLDVLVNNAGGSRPYARLILETSDADWRGMLGANLDSAFFCIRELAPLMITTGGGVIVNTSSVHALTGGRLSLGTYAAAKAGVIALTRAAARELGPKGVIVFAVAPGLVDTENLRGGMGDLVDEFGSRTPIGRAATPDEIADVVVALVKTAAAPLNGAMVELSGGLGDFYARPAG
jgi:NAD(P)-dependent dehydrogenase (short-subunit alcohol dehydrogenase family)